MPNLKLITFYLKTKCVTLRPPELVVVRLSNELNSRVVSTVRGCAAGSQTGVALAGW